MSRKGENIYRRKDGRWEGRYLLLKKADGKRKYGYVYAYSYRECREKLFAAKSTLKKDESESTEGMKKMLLQDISALWFSMKKPHLKESTIVKYNILISVHINPNLGNKKIEELSKKDIQEFTQRLGTSGKTKSCGLAPKTISDILSLLRNLIIYAHDMGYNCSPEICSVKIHQKQNTMRVLSLVEQKKYVITFSIVQI